MGDNNNCYLVFKRSKLQLFSLSTICC